MILKIVLGSGGRGLLDYISQLYKAPIHHPQNYEKLYAIPQSDPDFDSHRGAKPAANLSGLQDLSSLNLVHDSSRSRQGFIEVLLHQDARHDLERGPAVDADPVRRPGDQLGTAAAKGGARRVEKPSASPTFSTFAGVSPREIAAEFGELRRLKPNLKKAVGHLILSPSPDDRVLSKDEWQTALNLALAEHGATDALHAAWLHHDTDHPHLHVFFSRVTPAGQVVSDSHSYQKNRSASLKITQELQLTPLPTTQNAHVPADRRAAENAIRRAERRGDGDAAAIDAAGVRAALAESVDLADFQHHLDLIGLESEFQRRGQQQDIFGWKLRRVGQVEWQKASTLAKDLSWPKISHRFADAPGLAAAPTAAAATQVKTETETQAEKAPPQSFALLPNPEQKNQRAAAARAIRVEQFQQRRKQILEHDALGPLSKSMLLLGAVLNQFAMDMIARFIDWIKGLLARLFGFGVQQTVASDVNGQRKLTLQPTVIDVQAVEVHEPLQLEQRAQQAAQFVDQAAAALTTGNFDVLPGEACHEKAELVQTLKNSTAPALAARPGTASEQPKSGLGLEQMLKELEISAAAHKTLFFEHRLEAEKANSHPLQAKLSISKSRLAQLDSADTAWLAAHPIKARLGAQSPNFDAKKALRDQQRATQLELDIALEKQKRQAKAHIELLHEKVLKSQSDLLGAAKQIGNEVTALTHKSKFHPPLSQLSTELAGLVRPFEDNVQIFTVMPSKDRFQSALGLFEERIPRYQAALKKHPLFVETSAEVDSEAAIVSGAQLESELEDQDLTRPGFEAPKG